MHDFGSGPRRVAQPITFTPYASVRECSARCLFCSEALVHRETRVAGASLRPGPEYPRQLRRALRALRGLPIGVSLSGLEATDDVAWLMDVLDAIDEHAAQSPVGERVLYTNGRGLRDAHLVARLAQFGLARLEVSRHAVDQETNDTIMRFRDGVEVARRDLFEETIRSVARVLPLRLACVIQKGAIADADRCRHYLAWADELGVRDVVFRALAETHADYRPSARLDWQRDQRVPLEAILGAMDQPDFQRDGEIDGYYFRSIRFRRRDGMRVTFERSDYGDMKARHHSGTVYKLVLFANGALCADWDPEQEVLLRP
jgi:MoaA/NifB/PqqE/SkfB family radical SAM enzyme